MAGPAGGRGGGHRGGGGGGFGGGGGHRGGGFGGGHHGGFGGGPRRPFWGFYRPYHYHYGYYGGGFVGGLIGMIMVPIFIAIFALLFMLVNIFSAVSAIGNGGEVVYNEEQFQDYANASYYNHFSDTATEEDGIMVIILTYEDSQELAYVAWMGDNLNYRVSDLFGTDDEFGIYLERTVNIDNYKYSLSKDLAKVMDYMTLEVSSLGLNSPFIEKHDMSGAPKSALINRSDLDMNKNTVETSLENFTNETGIPAAVLVDTAENVFGRTMPTGSIIVALIALVIIGACVYSIAKSVKQNKRIKNDFKVNETSTSSGQRKSGLDDDTFR